MDLVKYIIDYISKLFYSIESIIDLVYNSPSIKVIIIY